MEPNVRETKRADELKPGDWIAPRELLDAAAEVLHVLTYEKPDGTGTTVHLVVRKQGGVVPYTDSVPSGTPFDLATEADLAELREQAERAQKIADIRALAAWLEANPDVPMPVRLSGQEQMADPSFHDGISPIEGVKRVREFAAKHGVKVDESDPTHTDAKVAFGIVEYKLLSWHRDGRPVEPEAAPVASVNPFGLSPAANAEVRERLGLAYSRADDETPDPTPTGPREPLHTGGMTDGGLVDETLPDATERAIQRGLGR
jgi:hypothetical protein